MTEQHMTPSDLQRLAGEDAYDESFIYSGPRIEKVRKIVALRPAGQKVLDVGCGNGTVLGCFAGVHELYGLEINPELAARANKIGVKAVVHDLEGGAMPFPDKTFDVVYCGETIEHQVDTDWLVAEINRVLKPGGTLILTFPNIRTVLGIVMMVFFDMPPMYASRYRAPHYRDFTLRTIKMVLRNHDFKPIQSIGGAFYLPVIGEHGSRLATFFPSWAHTTIITAIKVKDSVYSAEKSELVGDLYGGWRK